jgi:hypothetical protein
MKHESMGRTSVRLVFLRMLSKLNGYKIYVAQ